MPLSPAARKLADEATRPRTRDAYARALARFLEYCDATERDALDPESVAEYIAHRRALGRSAATLAADLVALRAHFRQAGRPAPDADLDVSHVAQGARRHAARNAPPAPAPALRLDDWRAAVRILARRLEPVAARDRAVLVIGYLAGMRRSELYQLDLDDVTIEADRGLLIVLRSSKTSDLPATIRLPVRADRATCPVAAWTDYLEHRGTRPGPAFLAAASGGSYARRPLEDGQRIGARHGIERILRRALEDAHVPDAASYSAHSLRAGLATELAEAGAPMSGIATHGRWSQLETVLRYARRAHRWQDNPLHRLA